MGENQKEPFLISIVTVVYNAEATLEKTIESVLKQKSKNIEYVLVDGGSTDGTLNILKKYSEKITWISEKDNGIYDAMNKGIELAHGKWLYFLGADDILCDCLNEVSTQLHEMTIIYGDVILKNEQKKYDGVFNSFKLIHKNISHQAIFYPSEVFKKYKYDLRYKYMADYFLNLQCWKDKSFSFKYIDVAIAEYNNNGLSSMNYDKTFIKDRFKIMLNSMPFYTIPYICMFIPFNNLILKLLRKI